MEGFFARTLAAVGRLLCALFALGTAALSAERWGPRASTPDFLPGASAAGNAIVLGAGTLALVGLSRLVLGATPGSERDPLRHGARLLARWRRPLGLSLAGAAVTCAATALALGAERVPGARVAALLLAFLALQSRQLPWFAGLRQAASGKVRFASARFHPMTALFVALLLLLGSLALLPVLQGAAIPLTATFVLGWLAWALPLSRVTLGKDGVQVSSWRERFYPFDGTVAASVDQDRLLVVDEGSRHRSLSFAPVGADERARLVERIREHLAPPDPATAAEGRAATELAAPLESLDVAGGYRVAAVPRETLWRIVEARAVAPRVRIRAAELVALEPHEDDLPRLRRVAESLAEPGMSEAIARLVPAAPPTGRG